MKWRYKSELRVKTLLWNILCQQRLAQQYRVEQVHGLVLGDSMDLAYQILTSTGGAKHDYFMLDGSYDHFYFLTNDHQGEVILALLCDPVKTAELDRILSQASTPAIPAGPWSRMPQSRMERRCCSVTSAICRGSCVSTPPSTDGTPRYADLL